MYELEVIIIWGMVLVVVFIVFFDHMVNKIHRRTRERGLLVPDIVHGHVVTEMEEELISRAILFDNTKSIDEPLSIPRIPIIPDEEIPSQYKDMKKLKKDHSTCPRCKYPKYRCMCHRMRSRTNK